MGEAGGKRSRRREERKWRVCNGQSGAKIGPGGHGSDSSLGIHFARMPAYGQAGRVACYPSRSMRAYDCSQSFFLACVHRGWMAWRAAQKVVSHVPLT